MEAEKRIPVECPWCKSESYVLEKEIDAGETIICWRCGKSIILKASMIEEGRKLERKLEKR